jgi:hypothetical protein
MGKVTFGCLFERNDHFACSTAEHNKLIVGNVDLACNARACSFSGSQDCGGQMVLMTLIGVVLTPGPVLY